MIHVVIVIVVVADHDQELREIYAAERKRLQLQHDQAQGRMTQITCSCGWTNWYETAGRAKMGLSAHRQRRKC